MTKREHFGAVMTMLSESFGRSLTKGMLSGYWLVLESLAEDELKRSAHAALGTLKFMPTAAELLAFARPKVDPGVAVVQAWQVVRRAIDKHDYLVATIDFGPLVNAVIRNLGGWDTLCQAKLPELDNPGWLRKRFEEIYRSLATAEPTTLHGSPLEGALPLRFQNPKHVIVSVDGSSDLLRLEANGAGDARASIAAHIEALADEKGTE